MTCALLALIEKKQRYNEPDLHERIEKRLGMPLKLMDPDDFSIENLLPSPLGEGAKKKKKTAETSAVAEKSRRAKKLKNQQVLLSCGVVWAVSSLRDSGRKVAVNLLLTRRWQASTLAMSGGNRSGEPPRPSRVSKLRHRVSLSCCLPNQCSSPGALLGDAL